MSLALIAASLMAAPAPAAGQGARGVATSTGRYVELRPFRADTIDAGRLQPGADGRWLLDGVPVPCRPDVPCVLFGAGERQHAYTFTQDLRFTAWGLGVRGLSATTYLRARARAGDFAWPRADDAFDALIAYLEYDRSPIRVRAGRQTTLGGLGFSSYDGASLLVEPNPGLAVEAYGGRSLARGLLEPRSDALRGLETFLPDPTVLLVGGALNVEVPIGMDLALRYQREIFADRSGLASERASAEAVITALAPVTLLASADYDFAFGRFGKSDVRLRLPAARGLSLEARVRRYLPYFELWTIWGFFDPVAYREAEALVAWTDGDNVGVVASGGLRHYEDPGTDVFGEDLDTDTRRISASAWWQAGPAFRVAVSGRRETGFGASYGGADLSVTWIGPADATLRPWLTAFEQVEDYRLGQGSVAGGGMDLTLPLSERWRLEGGAALFRNSSTRRDSPSWNQRRAWLAVRIEFGDDPGLGTPRGRR